MTEDFITMLDAEVGLSDQEKLVLKSVGVRNYEDLHALVQAFQVVQRRIHPSFRRFRNLLGEGGGRNGKCLIRRSSAC
jgi:hypothetical protein